VFPGVTGVFGEPLFQSAVDARPPAAKNGSCANGLRQVYRAARAGDGDGPARFPVPAVISLRMERQGFGWDVAPVCDTRRAKDVLLDTALLVRLGRGY